MSPTIATFWEEIAKRGVPALAKEISDSEAVQMTETYGTHNYKPLKVNMVRGEGALCWDGNGKEYIDCVGAYSAVAHGHLNLTVIEAAIEQLRTLSLASRAVYTSELALFLKGLSDYCGLDMVCPMNTGAEAIETAIKIARKWAYTVKGVPDNEAQILVCDGNFHGRTTTIVGFSTEPGYKAHFGPFTPGFKVVPFGDLDSMRAAVTPRTAAILAEPIQAEGGIIIPPDGYMAGLRQLCDSNNVLLIWDEVQTGFSRTGKRFAWQYEDAMPDLLAVGKPLGGGVMPVSATVGRREVMEVLKPGDHGSTFGGNPLGCVIALAALAEMEVSGYSEQSARKGKALIEGLASLNAPQVLELRGRGLLVGMEVHEGIDTKKLSENFLDQGLLTKETRNRTFRFTPPIVIEDNQVDEIVDKVANALKGL